MMCEIGVVNMKKTLVIIAHPEVESSSVQRFLIDSIKELPCVDHYLLREETPDVLADRVKLKQYQRIIFQFPMYWYSAPYILKKWLDEVFSVEFAENHLTDKELGIVVSLGLSEHNFASGRSEKYTLSEIFRPFEALANKCHMIFLPIFSIPLFSYLEEKEKKKLLIAYEQYLTKENLATFQSKETWFKEKLNHMIEGNTEEKEKLANILSVMEANREELEDLLVIVKEMRLEE